MGRKKNPGLFKRGQIWHIDKKINGVRISESTGVDKLEEAEKYLARKLETIRQASIYGVRPQRIFREAATKFLIENQHKRSISLDQRYLVALDPFIGDLPLESVHMGTLQGYIDNKRKSGVKNRTINLGLQVTRRILNLASSEWMDGYGLTWLSMAPKIRLLPETDTRKPYPLTWEEQDRIFSYLPDHLKAMAVFAINTGCRDKEICQLKWHWEVKIPDLNIQSVFVIPGKVAKNGESKVVVLNEIARKVIEQQRTQKSSDSVFHYKGKPILRMLNTAWKNARGKAGLNEVRVHDLRHTFGSRLRAAGVSFEDRQDLLGHKSTRVTTHYSCAEISNLWKAVNKICSKGSEPILNLLRVSA